MTESSIILNEHRAAQFIDSIGDTVVRNLVTLAVAEARARTIRRSGQTEEAWRAMLPDSPLDLYYYAQTVAAVFRQADVIRALLDGGSLEKAAGWDIG